MVSTRFLATCWLLLLVTQCSDTSAVPTTTAAQWLSERSSSPGGRSSSLLVNRRAPPPANEKFVYRLATDYGADPTGTADSSDAIDRALVDMWAHPPTNASGGNWMDPEGGQLVGPDLGGAVLDLEGGTYGVSRPVRFPTLGGGECVRGGVPRWHGSVSFCGRRICA